MGSVESYETTKGRRYRVRYRTPDHRQTDKRGFKTKREADLFLASLEISKARGEFVHASAAKATIATLGPLWFAGLSHLKPSSLAPLEIAWRVYVEPRWGATPISRIDHSDVRAWVAELSAGRAITTKAKKTPLGATSVIRAHSVLSGILDVAVRDRRLTTNPARGVALPRKARKTHAYLSHAQVEALASQSGQHDTLVRFLSYTGLRWGEATGLRVRHLDMLRRRVQVEENAVRVNGVIIVGTPKSHHVRSVPFPAFLSVELARLCEGKSRDALVFGNGTSHLQQPTANGGWFVAAIKRVKLADETMPTPTVHDLRHTAASLAISTGANVKAVQRMLGHASAAMTLDIYADLFEDDLDAVSDALDSARIQAGVGKLWAETPPDEPIDLDLARKQRELDPDSDVPSLGLEPRLKRF